jgi:hypothetical protein
VTKRYRETLATVVLAAERGRDEPASFEWRGQQYRVTGVLGHWREDPGWWRRPSGEPVRIEQTDMWRVEARNGKPATGVYELVRRGDQWRLDRVWD